MLHLSDKCRGMFWSLYLRMRGAQVGKNLLVHGPLDILLRDGASLRNVIIGNDVTLGGKIYIRLRRKGRILIGDSVTTGTEVWLVAAREASLTIGKNTKIGSYTILNGGHGIRIGEYCLLAAFVYLNSSDHQFDGPDLIQNQGHTGAPIDIGNDVWLAGHVIVTQGIKIGQGAVLGAGSVVTHEIPAYKVAVGVPARVIRDRKRA
jgi:acetyltransferase-like isoleucine patch superfamily enzyme